MLGRWRRGRGRRPVDNRGSPVIVLLITIFILFVTIIPQLVIVLLIAIAVFLIVLGTLIRIIPTAVTLVLRVITSAIVRVPNCGVPADVPVPVVHALMPPIVRTRMVMIPVHDMMMMPIEVLAQPRPNDKPDAKCNERRSRRRFIIDLRRLVVRHINVIGIGGNNFDIT